MLSIWTSQKFCRLVKIFEQFRLLVSVQKCATCKHLSNNNNNNNNNNYNNNNNMELSRLKAFADDKVIVTQN